MTSSGSLWQLPISSDFRGRLKRSSGKPKKMTSDVAWVLRIAGSYSPVMAVDSRWRSFKLCSLEIESGKAVKNDVRCSMGATESGFQSLTFQLRTVDKMAGDI